MKLPEWASQSAPHRVRSLTSQSAPLKLTEFLDTPGLQNLWRSNDRKREGTTGAAALGDLHHAEEVTGNVAMTCRYYGITRQSFYTWNGATRSSARRASGPVRAAEGQPPGHPRGRGGQDPLPAPELPLRAGQDLDVPQALPRREISQSGVWRILKRLDMSRLPDLQRYKRLDKRWQRYEKQLPGHQVQIDVKFIARSGVPTKKYYQFTAIDDCTRLRVLRIYPKLNQKTAIQFVDYVLEKLPFVVQVIQTDNGAEFGSSFHYHVLDKGVGHKYIKPRTPASTARSKDLTASMPRSSIGSSTGPSSTTPRSSTTSSRSGRTTTTTIAPTGAWRPNPLRATKAEDQGPRVSGDRQSHTHRVRPSGFEPETCGLRVRGWGVCRVQPRL